MTDTTPDYNSFVPVPVIVPLVVWYDLTQAAPVAPLPTQPSGPGTTPTSGAGNVPKDQ